jgi:DNA-binding NtrC family response regulator
MLTLVADCYGRTVTFPLREDLKEIRAGSLPDNTIYLPYKGVSRHHFLLLFKESRWLLQDLGSKNGTSLNGEKITEGFIQTGDTIQAGIIRLSVKASRKEEIEAVPLKETVILQAGDPETDKLGHLPLKDQESIFSFPRLRFPEGLVLGKSPVMMEVYQKLHAIAESDANVLFVGETGVGKEMFAQTLHLSGKRSQGPFVPVNCAAIPSALAEAELFGIGEKVATDVASRKGKMVLADRGTLFLDELSSIPADLQAKLLRAVEDRAIAAVGEHRAQKVDFRLTAATNQHPKELLRVGRLREDLYHRLATVEIHIPPLRERKGDIEILIMGLLQHLSGKEAKHIPAITRRLFAELSTYSYPGNVRELINILTSMVALAHPGEVLDVHLLPPKVREERVEDLLDLDQTSLNLHEALDEMSRRMITRALKLHNGNISRTAQHLGLTPFGLRKMIKRLGIGTTTSDQ